MSLFLAAGNRHDTADERDRTALLKIEALARLTLRPDLDVDGSAGRKLAELVLKRAGVRP